MNNIQERLTEIIKDKAGGKYTVFAKNADIPHSTFQNYMNGRMPHSDHLLRIHAKYGVNINWLLTGKGEKYISESQETSGDPIQIDILRQIIEGVEEGLKKNKLNLNPEKKARLISLLYEHYAESDKKLDSQTVTKYLQLVA